MAHCSGFDWDGDNSHTAAHNVLQFGSVATTDLQILAVAEHCTPLSLSLFPILYPNQLSWAWQEVGKGLTPTDQRDIPCHTTSCLTINSKKVGFFFPVESRHCLESDWTLWEMMSDCLCIACWIVSFLFPLLRFASALMFSCFCSSLPCWVWGESKWLCGDCWPLSVTTIIENEIMQLVKITVWWQ